jgi:hypothetical protein
MLHRRGRINTLATWTNHKEPLMARIPMVVVCNVIRVMKNSTNTMEKLLAKVAFMWAGRIIDVRHLAINASCTIKRWWSIITTLGCHGTAV